MENFDLIVIGGGPAGYAASLRGAGLGARVILIEQSAIGGTCVNRGCIPTKFMTEVAESAKAIDNLQAFGLEGSLEPVNLERVRARRDALIQALADGMTSMLTMGDIEFECGAARFVGQRELTVRRADGSSRQITAPKIIVATGASAMPVSELGLDEDLVRSGDNAFEMERIPENLLIVGGDAVALELASVYNALGSKVTVVDKGSQILPGEDGEMAEFLTMMLEQSGLSFQMGTSIEKLRVDENGYRLVDILDGRQRRQIVVQEVIVSPRRVSNVAGVGLEAIGVSLVDGAVATNARMETSVEGIYAAGDVTGGRMLSHIATAQGQVAADNALGVGRRFNSRVVPRCIYTLPQLACVGLTEEEAQSKGLDIKIGMSSLGTNARAATMARRTGMVKVIADAAHGELLGVHLLAPGASEMIAQAVLALTMECTLDDFGRVSQFHPTLAEAVVEAAKAAS